MDALDQLAEPAHELLSRVDGTLTRCGAPAGHPVWPLLRRVRALPGAAVGALTELRPGPLAAAGRPLRSIASGYREATPTPAAEWQGSAADEFAARWVAVCAYGDSLSGRLSDTDGYLSAVAGWLAGARRAVAGTLAGALVSTEAVRVRTAAEEESALAAADLAAHVLAAVARVYEEVMPLVEEWSPRLTEVPFRSGDASGPPPGRTEVVP